MSDLARYSEEEASEARAQQLNPNSLLDTPAEAQPEEPAEYEQPVDEAPAEPYYASEPVEQSYPEYNGGEEPVAPAPGPAQYGDDYSCDLYAGDDTGNNETNEG